MKTIPDLAREILSRSPTPALPLPGLVEAIEEETTGHLPSPARILTEIRSRPDLFRVLDPVIGPWRRAKAEPGGPPRGAPQLGFSASLPTPERVRQFRLAPRKVFGAWEGGSTRIQRWPWHVGFY
jgi:hypothetical protein